MADGGQTSVPWRLSRSVTNSVGPAGALSLPNICCRSIRVRRGRNGTEAPVLAPSSPQALTLASAPADPHGILANAIADLVAGHPGRRRSRLSLDELARARRVADLGAAAALADRRAERRRRAAEPDLDFREFCRRSKLPQSERSWDLFADERYQRGETDIPPYKAYNPFRHHQQGPYA